MSLLIFFIVFYLLLSISLYFLFPKAGVAAWKGLVPGLNFIEWCNIVGRPTWWAALLLLPIVNFFILVGLAVEMVRSFGKYKFYDSLLAAIATPFYFLYLGISSKEKYLGKTRALEQAYKLKLEEASAKGKERELKKLQSQNPYKKSALREWAEAIIFAVFAAAFIRMFLIEAYVIPTPSMEGSLLVGDFLFVSKAHYGIRTPKTVMMLPLIHNRIPGTSLPSYLVNPNLPFKRFGALESVDRNDMVVFNFPEGDSVYFFPERTWSVNDYRRGAIEQQIPFHHQQIKAGKVKVTYRPIDKKDHYIKRCVAVGGDTIQVKERALFVNGKPANEPKHLQYRYFINYPPNTTINTARLEQWGIEDNPSVGDVTRDRQGNIRMLTLTEEQRNNVQTLDPNIEIQPLIFTTEYDDPKQIFPHDPANYAWTRDNYGPIWIPKKGATVTLTPENIAIYKRIISIYEENDFEEKSGKFFINGQETNQYTFKMNYYWMMGDNRHNSEDSRIWGFVPEDHVVGKPLFIWMSAKEGSPFKGIRFNRIFKSADKN